MSRMLLVLPGISFLTSKTATIVSLFRLLATCEKIFIWSAPQRSAIHANTAQGCSLLRHFWQTSPYPNPRKTDPDPGLTSIRYPVGTGSSAIRPSMAPNRRRFRCPSASSSQ